MVFCYSVTGKKLMAKCRMLIQENQELGRQLSQGRVAQLEAELALQKKYSDELKGSQDGKYKQSLGTEFCSGIYKIYGPLIKLLTVRLWQEGW